MNTNKVNTCIKNFEFLIHYAEKVGSKNLDKIFKKIEDITDPCIVIGNLFSMNEIEIEDKE